MEIILLIVGWWFISWIYGALTSSSKKDVQEFMLRAQVRNTKAGDAKYPIWEVQLKGIFPVRSRTDLGILISIIDSTDEAPIPIFAAIDELQEPSGHALLIGQELGACNPFEGFKEWVPVAGIPKDLVLYPKSGSRKIKFLCRLVDANNPPAITNGRTESGHPGLVSTLVVEQIVHVKRGFMERSEEELAIAASSVRLAVRLALADGKFAAQEGEQIKEWASMFVQATPDPEAQEKAREFINDAIRWAVKDGVDGISISDQVAVLNKHADKPEKYSALELCLDVMAADGIADKAENEMLNHLCEALDLNLTRFNEMKEKKSIGLEHGGFDASDIWGRLDIDRELSSSEKKKRLNALYAKWNSRAESLECADERKRAQEMLDLIATARHELRG